MTRVPTWPWGQKEGGGRKTISIQVLGTRIEARTFPKLTGQNTGIYNTESKLRLCACAACRILCLTAP
eukprot:696335-Amphidinium_carterae.1